MANNTQINGSLLVGYSNIPLDARSILFIAGDTPTATELQTIVNPCIGLHINIFKGTQPIKSAYLGEYNVTDIETIEDDFGDQSVVIKEIEKVGDADAKNIAADALVAAQEAKTDAAKVTQALQAANNAQLDATEALSKYQALADNYATLSNLTVDDTITASDVVAINTAVAEIQGDLYTTQEGGAKTSKILALEQADATMSNNFDTLKSIMLQFIVGMSEASYNALVESGNVSDGTLYLLWETSDAPEEGDSLDETFTLDLSVLG